MYSLTFRIRLYDVNACHVCRLPIRVALCCHSNETRALISNPPNSAQLRGTPYHSPKLHPGPCSSVGMWPRTKFVFEHCWAMMKSWKMFLEFFAGKRVGTLRYYNIN